MLAHLGEPLSMQDIARATSLSVRTLHRAVPRESGASPMVVLRRARLRMARADLMAPGPRTTVTAAALQWGFTHLGRFARDYARQFGEAPSETLRRARRPPCETPSPTAPVVPAAWMGEGEWPAVGGAA